MKNRITAEMIRHVESLAKLQLSSEEKEQAKNNMERMLDYVDILKEIDAAEEHLDAQIRSGGNFFREDIVSNEDMQEQMMSNAPEEKDGYYKIPRVLPGNSAPVESEEL